MMQNAPIQENLVLSTTLFFALKSVAWISGGLVVLAAIAAAVLGVALHTPGGKKLVLCPIYDATIVSRGGSPASKYTLGVISKEWRGSPRPSPDWAYLPIDPIGVVPVPIQNWSKRSLHGGGDVLLHISSDIMEIKLEKSSLIPASLQMRRLQEQVITDPIALLNPSKAGELVYLWQSAIESFRGVDQTAALKESFRTDLSKQCSSRLHWKKILARLGMANEKTKSGIQIVQAWRNVTPASLTLVGQDAASFGWTVKVIFNTDTANLADKLRKPSNTLKLNYSGLSEPMMHSVMKQIGLIRDTSLADRDLPANFFQRAEDTEVRENLPIASGEYKAPRL